MGLGILANPPHGSLAQPGLARRSGDRIVHIAHDPSTQGGSQMHVFWSDEDEGYVAIDTTRLGCSAWGATEEDARRELMEAQRSWDQAQQSTRQGASD